MPKPVSKVGADKPDMKEGNKVAPTTKHVPEPPGKAKSHEGHGHKGTPQHP